MKKESLSGCMPGGQMRQGEKQYLFDCLKGKWQTLMVLSWSSMDLLFTFSFFEIMSRRSCDERHCHSNQYCMGCLQVRQLEKRNERGCYNR